MIRTTLRTVLALAILGITSVVLASTPAKAQNQNMEVIHHPNYDKNVFMPFVPMHSSAGPERRHARCEQLALIE